MPAQAVEVGNAAQISEGSVRVVTAGDRRLALCKYRGQLYAIDDVCTHDGGPLGQGELIDNEIECPRHGARFDIRTGRPTCLPAVLPVRTYPVRVDDEGRVFVEVGS
jgi:3-phenylpropionate/trans-cinnamate dioxygenase ferredoxin subunit